jgi:hypothetical protein
MPGDYHRKVYDSPMSKTDPGMFAGVESDQFPEGQLSEEEAGEVHWQWLAECVKTIFAFRVLPPNQAGKDTRKSP